MKPEERIQTRNDGIDRILGGEEQLVPSSGFVSCVMERVREEAIAPKPIPFPWKRALPGLVLAAGTIGWLIYEFIRTAMTGGLSFSGSISPSSIRLPSISQQTLGPAVWIGLALAISLASWALARRMARRASMF